MCTYILYYYYYYFEDFEIYSGLWPLWVSPWCQCVLCVHNGGSNTSIAAELAEFRKITTYKEKHNN